VKTTLVVDDEDVIRRAVRDMLESEHYTDVVIPLTKSTVALRAAVTLRLADRHCRSRKRWILPVAVLGSSDTNSIQRGYL
jgi:DNA-binding response OmpR family regulator